MEQVVRSSSLSVSLSLLRCPLQIWDDTAISINQRKAASRDQSFVIVLCVCNISSSNPFKCVRGGDVVLQLLPYDFILWVLAHSKKCWNVVTHPPDWTVFIFGKIYNKSSLPFALRTFTSPKKWVIFLSALHIPLKVMWPFFFLLAFPFFHFMPLLRYGNGANKKFILFWKKESRMIWEEKRERQCIDQLVADRLTGPVACLYVSCWALTCCLIALSSIYTSSWVASRGRRRRGRREMAFNQFTDKVVSQSHPWIEQTSIDVRKQLKWVASTRQMSDCLGPGQLSKLAMSGAVS